MLCDAEALVEPNWVFSAARAACLAATCSQAQVSGPYLVTQVVVEPRALCSETPRYLLSQAGYPMQLGQLAWQQPAAKHKYLVHVL